MSFPSKPALLAAAVLSALAAHADTQLPTVVVQATGIAYTDVDAPYASEVHDRGMIEASGATSLVDYLAQHSSLTVKPSYGNSAAPSIDMRGYGMSNGFENIAISVDGRRLNEIDGVPPLLGSIPLASIERIEITKGSGSVAFGDGATAGSIQIYTRAYQGVSVAAVAGSHGLQSLNVNAGMQKEWGGLSLSSSNESAQGATQADVTGHHATSENRNERAHVEFKPLATLKLTAEGSNSYIDLRYVNPLTAAQFEQNPAQNESPLASAAGIYAHQIYQVNQWRLGAELDLGNNWLAKITHNDEQKTSDYSGYYYGSYSTHATYDYQTYEALLSHKGEHFDLAAGWRDFDGARTAPTSAYTTGNTTSKRSNAEFVQGAYHLGAWMFSAGARQDQIAYAYVPLGGPRAATEYDLNAWDLGTNFRLNEQTSFFANFNSAFLAPDIDSLFNWTTGQFSNFIPPTRSRTFNFGVNHDFGNNRLRLTLFRARLNNEIYYDPLSGSNTNLDHSHKQGLEVQDTWQANEQLSLSARYTFTQARIDQTSQEGGAYDGKAMPGVPRQGVNLGLAYQWAPGYSVNLDHVWRASSYALNDFANSMSQRQAAYQLTNLALHYRQQDWEAFATVANLFDRKNGVWVQDNAIYPVDFSRSFKIGVRKNF